MSSFLLFYILTRSIISICPKCNLWFFQTISAIFLPLSHRKPPDRLRHFHAAVQNIARTTGTTFILPPFFTYSLIASVICYLRRAVKFAHFYKRQSLWSIDICWRWSNCWALLLIRSIFFFIIARIRHFNHAVWNFFLRHRTAKHTRSLEPPSINRATSLVPSGL